MKTALLSVLSLITVTGATADSALLPPIQRSEMVTIPNTPYVTVSVSRQALASLGEMNEQMNPRSQDNPTIIIVPEAPPIILGKNLPITIRPLVAAALTAVGSSVLVVNKPDAERMAQYYERLSGLPGTPAYNRTWLAQQGRFFTVNANIIRYDESVKTERKNFMASLLIGVKWAFQIEPSVEFNRCHEFTELGILLQLEDQNGFQVPGSQTEVTVILAKRNKSDKLGLLVYGSGGQYTAERGSTDGIGDACERAVDYATLALLGKVFSVPYWRCTLNGGQKDEAVMKMIKKEFRSFASNNITNLNLVAQRYLRLCGQEVSETGVMDDPTRQALVKFAQQRNLPPAGCLTEDIYAELHLAMPMPFQTYEPARNVITPSPAGPTVVFEGFKGEDSDRFYAMLCQSKNAVRVERDSANVMKFTVVDYRDKIDALSTYIHKCLSKNFPEYKTPLVSKESERCIRVHLGTNLLARK